MHTIDDYKQHPLSAVFPPMPDPEYLSLCSSIATHGLDKPIVVLDGMVLDGWHRLNACCEQDIAPRFVDYTSAMNPAAWVVIQNVERRHLTPSQRAMIAARMIKLNAECNPGVEATPSGLNVAIATRVNPGTSASKITQFDAADALGVDRTAVCRAEAVLSKATPDVIEACECGEIGVRTAAEIAELPPKAQERVASAVKTKGRARARQLAETLRKAAAGDFTAEPTNLTPIDGRSPQLDAKDQPIKTQRVADAFVEVCGVLKHAGREINGVIAALEEMAEQFPELALKADIPLIRDQAETLRANVLAPAPYARCGMCDEKGCGTCNNSGWLTRGQYDAIAAGAGKPRRIGRKPKAV